MIVETVKIPISGLTQKYAFFHISDTHMRYSADEATQNTEVFQRASNLKARECFEKIVDRVRREDAVGLFITGDCLEGVHDNAAYFRRVTDSCGKDILYVLGNHETSRFEYREDLAALLPGNPMYWVKDYGEFLVVGIDNTNRVLRPEQIDFLKEQTARGLPILLLMHIPIYTHENDHALRVRWGGDGHDLFSLGLENTVPETMEFTGSGYEDFRVVIRNTGGLMVLAPLLVLYVCGQRFLIQGIESSGLAN